MGNFLGFFEDLNGDFKSLFHGTQNIDGQVNYHLFNLGLKFKTICSCFQTS